MPTTQTSANQTKHAEAVDASWAATRGAVYGAATWGAATALLAGVGYLASPIYRGFTIQFKVYVFSCCCFHISDLVTGPYQSIVSQTR